MGAAAEYPPQLCNAIFKGCVEQLEKDTKPFHQYINSLSVGPFAIERDVDHDRAVPAEVFPMEVDPGMRDGVRKPNIPKNTRQST